MRSCAPALGKTPDNPMPTHARPSQRLAPRGQVTYATSSRMALSHERTSYMRQTCSHNSGKKPLRR